MKRRPVPLARQVLVLQIGVIVLVAGVGFALAAVLLDRGLTRQYGQRALGVARTAAADEDLARQVARDRQSAVQQAADRVRQRTGALFIVVTDQHGIRLAHPNPGKVGHPVTTDPTRALGGQDVVEIQRGTLGLSARGKVPLRAADGAVVGEVSVGFDAEDIDRALFGLLAVAAACTGGALLLGVIGSALLTRLLKRRTLGLEPHDLAALVREREAVLFGIGEGVLAVDAHRQISVCNGEAARLLDIDGAPGTSVDDLELPPRLRAVLDEHQQVDNLITVTRDRVLVARHRTVHRNGAHLGGVLTLRDRTDLETLSRELESVRGTADVLRAQRHEFTNRLHTLSGLLQTEHHREAVDYLQSLFSSSVAELGPATEAVRDTYLVAFLSAKKASTSEKGVVLELGETSWVDAPVSAPLEATTVLGNLVDNAADAARGGARRPARVEVDLLSEETTLHLSVTDTGDGIPAEFGEDVFTEGVSTRVGEGNGLGLALARQAARSLGGDVHVAHPGGREAEHGAVFVARLPAALAPNTEPANEQEANS